ASQLHVSDVRRVTGDARHLADLPVEIIISSIDRSSAVLQRLPHGAIIIPADAQPYTDMIAGCAELLDKELGQASPSAGVTRRISEIIMLQIIGYARSRLPGGI